MVYTAIGRVVNLASRLEEASFPNSIFISDDTRKLVSEFVPCQDSGEVNAKGFSSPIKIWKVM